jgi:hypothetical protein
MKGSIPNPPQRGKRRPEMKTFQVNNRYGEKDFTIQVKKNGGILVGGTVEFSPLEVMAMRFADVSFADIPPQPEKAIQGLLSKFKLHMKVNGALVDIPEARLV